MVAARENIPSDLTLEIGDDLSPERFLAAVRAFFGYVEEVGNALVPEGARLEWTVQVREGSALIGVDPMSSVPPQLVENIYTKIEESIRHLVDGDIAGARLPESALKHLLTLAEFAEKPRTKPTPLRMWVRRKPVAMEPNIGRVIREDWQSDYSDYGTIEGRLETIQDRGKLEIRIRDVMFRQIVSCHFTEEMLPEVFENFRKRVEVSGIIHFRKNGAPISIKVEEITRLPDDSELPTATDVRGILGAAH